MLSILQPAASVPAPPRQFKQPIDHFAAPVANRTFLQRYYLNDTSFAGPGHPLLVIMGGEGAIPPSTGFFYPWVVDVLAPRFKALVLEPEHRFYGTSAPREHAYELPMLRHLTPQQALADTVDLIREVQRQKQCTAHGTPGYCPVITIGGSYPGWMSAMMRLRYPAVVDGAYAASAPMKFYAQQIDEYAYYKVITASAGTQSHWHMCMGIVWASRVCTYSRSICRPWRISCAWQSMPPPAAPRQCATRSPLYLLLPQRLL